MLSVRKAKEKDIPTILNLLTQVDMVHHLGRPDIFKGPATKYNGEELKEILNNDKTPVFVCVDENDTPLGHAFCIHKQEKNSSVLTGLGAVGPIYNFAQYGVWGKVVLSFLMLFGRLELLYLQ